MSRRTTIRRRPSSPPISRFTRGELFASLAIVTATALFLGGVLVAPLLAQTQEQAEQASCASNLKQLSLGFLMYVQDYDEIYPPVAEPITKGGRVLSGWAVTHDTQGKAAVSAVGQRMTTTANPFTISPVFPYVKNNGIYHCPSVSPNSGPLSYMMNDLVSSKPQATIAAPAASVLLCDGENFAGNTGHAYDPLHSAAPARFTTKGAVITGAVMKTAPVRHRGGANYGFLDGHVKWIKPSSVFFPPRSSGSASHRLGRTKKTLGPDPTNLSAKGLSATFHLN